MNTWQSSALYIYKRGMLIILIESTALIKSINLIQLYIQQHLIPTVIPQNYFWYLLNHFFFVISWFDITSQERENISLTGSHKRSWLILMYLYDHHRNPTVVDYLPPIVTKTVKDYHTSRVCEKNEFWRVQKYCLHFQIYPIDLAFM